MQLLQNHVNIHVGGIDLRFPHHENERAQSNAATETETVDLWVHGEHLLFEGRKMSKSSGNVVLLSDVVSRGLDPLSARLCFLENRYRSQMDLTWSALEIADAQLGKWRRKTALWGTSTELKVDPEFLEAIENDLDTPRALQRLRLIEKSQEISDSDKRAFFIYADKTLGLDLTRVVLMRDISKDQQDMLSERSVARSEKRWADSDALRLALENSGLAIKDGASGQEWSWR